MVFSPVRMVQVQVQLNCTCSYLAGLGCLAAPGYFSSYWPQLSVELLLLSVNCCKFCLSNCIKVGLIGNSNIHIHTNSYTWLQKLPWKSSGNISDISNPLIKSHYCSLYYGCLYNDYTHTPHINKHNKSKIDHRGKKTICLHNKCHCLPPWLSLSRNMDRVWTIWKRSSVSMVIQHFHMILQLMFTTFSAWSTIACLFFSEMFSTTFFHSKSQTLEFF